MTADVNGPAPSLPQGEGGPEKQRLQLCKSMAPAVASTPPTVMLCLGHISGAHGLKGEVRIESYTAVPEDIAAYGVLASEDGAQRFEVLSLRPGKGGAVIARLAGVSDRDAAERLKGVRLYIERARLPEPETDEWYHGDLIGLAAIDADGQKLGDVVSVQNFGAGDLLEIRLADSRKTGFVPFTAECVPHVDVKGGRLTVVPPWRLNGEA